MSKKNKDNEETYMAVGMIWGVAFGSIGGAIISSFTKITYYPIFLSVGMMIGMIFGSGIKKNKK